MYHKIYIISLIMLIMLMIATMVDPETADPTRQEKKDIKVLFDGKYNEWLRHRHQIIGFRSYITREMREKIYECEPFQQIIKLGIPALPFIIEKIIEKHDLFLSEAVVKIAKVKFHIEKKRTSHKRTNYEYTVEEFPDIKPDEYGWIDFTKVWACWWEKGIKQTPERFEKLYGEWKSLKELGKEKEAEEKYQRMIDLGIVALPFMMKKVEEGDLDLVPAISNLTDGAIERKATASQCLQWWNKNKQKWIIPFPDAIATSNPRELAILNAMEMKIAFKTSEVVQSGANLPAIKVAVNGKTLPTDVVMARGSALVLPELFRKIGAKVDIGDKIVIKRNKNAITLFPHIHQAKVHGKVVKVDVPAIKTKCGIMLPLRLVAEALGAKVKWDAKARKISIWIS